MNTGDFLVDRLKAWGIRRIYGYPGDGIDGVIGSLQKDGGIDFIQARHEEMAAFMAVGHAKFTGEVGVCLATGGPGARTSSPVSTMPGSTISRYWPSAARPRRPSAALAISRN